MKTGIVYVIQSLQTELVYVGSTIKKLSDRFRLHMSHYKQWLNGKRKGCSSAREILMFEDAWIAEIDRITLEDQEPRRKLRMLEQYWIEQFADMCVNKQHAFQILTENEQKSIWKKRNRKLVNKQIGRAHV